MSCAWDDIANRVSAEFDSRIETPLECLDRVGLADLADRQIRQLGRTAAAGLFGSGTAQEADLYFMDEPLRARMATEQAILEVPRKGGADHRCGSP